LLAIIGETKDVGHCGRRVDTAFVEEDGEQAGVNENE